MSNISVLKIGKENYNLFYRLHMWRKTGNDCDNSLSESIPKYLEQQNYYLYVVVVDELPAGYVSSIVIPKTDSRLGTMFIDDIWVAPKYRRNGFAKLLIAKVKQTALHHNLWRLRLCVQNDNNNAIALYESQGLANISDCMFMECNVMDE